MIYKKGSDILLKLFTEKFMRTNPENFEFLILSQTQKKIHFSQ